jgi:hypothetical protein
VEQHVLFGFAVLTTNLLRGIASLRFFKLFTLASLMMMYSFGSSSSRVES